MKSCARKLSTGDVLVYDQDKKHAYLLQPGVDVDLMREQSDLIDMAGELVSCGYGVSLDHSRLNQLNLKTANIEFLS